MTSTTTMTSTTAMPHWLLCVLLLALRVTESQANDGPAPPQQVSLEADNLTRQLSITWEGGQTSTFDIEILRTELMETVFNETVSVRADVSTGKQRWNWTSVEPLECTSLSVRLRSREGPATSDWTPLQTLAGMDHPSHAEAQMYPVGGPVGVKVTVGTNMTFCCIVAEGKSFGSLWYKLSPMNTTRLSRRSYAATQTNQGPSSPSGTNVVCVGDDKEVVTGTVVFVGYTPLPSDLVCETRDLVSVVCQWLKGRETYLYGKKRQTYYTLNGRTCTEASQNMKMFSSANKIAPVSCGLESWEGNWTMVAKNPLGQFTLTDTAQLSLRIRPVAPLNLSTSEVNPWNASVAWQWEYVGFETLALVCQVNLTTYWHTSTHTFTGVGLKAVMLKDLQPDEDYSATVRCGAQRNFWKWGNWSTVLTFRTEMDRPEAPDIWIWMDTDSIGRLLWKPLSRRESHGQISGYEVMVWSSEENSQHTRTLPQTVYSLPLNLTSMGGRVVVTVTTRNPAGVSGPANLVVPRHHQDTVISKVSFSDSVGGFRLAWSGHVNASDGYVVEWYQTGCAQDCSVDWVKVLAENTNITLQSDHFLAGVRYTFSLYACSSEAAELMESWEGYWQELVPSRSVPRLTPNQQGSNVQLSWDPIPLEHQRGFILGYSVYLTNASHLQLIANLQDPQQTNYTVKSLALGAYKFTVKAYTSIGEDGGSTVSISLEPYTDWLVPVILVTLGSMASCLLLVTILCYKKRKWVKKAFYPDIPEPKLPGDWTMTQGTLDVKPSPHSMVHIVEHPEWDSSKEALVVVPEEDEDEEGSVDTDSDEPSTLRYYNQVVEEEGGRRPAPDTSGSSTSSMDSTRTNVTYTGIQTSASSLALQPQPEASCLGSYRPQMHPASGPAEPQLDPQLDPQDPRPPAVGPFGGYQPQCSWRLDSPEAEFEGGFAPSLGSPTSVTSSQFLLPEAAASDEGKGHGATTWFHNMLTGKP